MNRIIGSIFLSFFIQLTGFTQNKDSLIYTKETIYQDGGYFIKGNNKLTFTELQNEFSFSKDGMELYTKAKKYRKSAKILQYVSLFSTVGIAIFLKNNKYSKYAFFGVQIVTGFSALHFIRLSNQSINKGIWIRNKDALFR